MTILSLLIHLYLSINFFFIILLNLIFRCGDLVMLFRSNFSISYIRLNRSWSLLIVKDCSKIDRFCSSTMLSRLLLSHIVLLRICIFLVLVLRFLRHLLNSLNILTICCTFILILSIKLKKSTFKILLQS